ncbi:MAG: hypothetical protein AAF696_24940, partial [Bacteroidota bacterium]
MNARIRRTASYQWLRFSWLSLSFLLALGLSYPMKGFAQITASGTETQINTTSNLSQQKPDVAMDSTGNYVVVWESFGTDGSGFGIYAQRFLTDGTRTGTEFNINSTTIEDQRFPSVAMDQEGNFVICWMDEIKDGSGWGIYAQQYSNTGVANGAEFLVNTTTTGHQKFPQIAMDKDGDYVITWMEIPLDGSSFQIKAQRYNFSSGAQGSEFPVESSTLTYQGYPQIAMAANGSFAISWQRAGADGSGMAIAARTYSPTGLALASTFQPNTTPAANQQAPAIGMDSLGNFIIVWSSYAQDGDAEGIYAQRYTSNGSRIGAEFRVSSTPTAAQTEPQIAMNREGGFSIAWSSYGQDGSFAGVYVKAYNANGDSLDTEILVNTRTLDFQQFPALAQSKANAQLFITWQDGLRNSTSTNDGSNYGIFGQQYRINTNTPPVAVCQNLTVPATQNCRAEVMASQIDNGSSDAEGSFTLKLEPPGPYALGTHPISLVITDLVGETDTCEAVITVVDRTSPQISNCPGPQTIPMDPGLCTGTVPDLISQITATDICGTVSLRQTPTAGSSFGQSHNDKLSVTIIADDGNGNRSSCTVLLSLIDTEVPVFATCPTNIEVCGEQAVSWTLPTVSDNCANPVLVGSHQPGD